MKSFRARMRRAFKNQIHGAKRRGIPWEFSWADWETWWLTEDRWYSRGRRPWQLCMARVGDVGPYSLANVRCITGAENHREYVSRYTPEERSAAARARWTGRTCWLAGRTGAEHPKSRRVLTPTGEYPSAQAAAVACGITRQAAAIRAQRGTFGWHYASA